MTNYPFKMQLVVDPDNPRNIVAAGSVSIYDSDDTALTTLLALTDPNGVPITNPITSNSQGFTPPFVSTSPEVLWVSGTYRDYFQSYQGMRDEAIAAKVAAEAAAATAGAEAAAVADAAIGTATDEATAAASSASAAASSAASAESNASASATAAANSAALVGAPADTAIAAAINGTGQTKTALDAAYATTASLAGKLDTTTAAATYAGKSATGYAGSPNIIQDPTLAPSDVDARTLKVPERPNPTPDIDKQVVVGGRRNLWQYTEDVASNRYSVGGSGTVKQTDTMTVPVSGAPVTLTRISASNFYASLRSTALGLGITPFTVGRRYLISYYAVLRSDAERFVWMRDFYDTQRGHGQRLLEPNKPTRIWTVLQATTTSKLSAVQDPAVGFNTSDSDPYWLFSASSDVYDVYVGGFQIEDIGTTPVDGIAAIGDSTIQGSSGTKDSPNAKETVGYLAGLLNVNTYNRAVGGERLDQMDTRWATDITPMKNACKYAIIQGGINDIAQGRTLAQMQTSISSMVTKAGTDGLIPVILTCTPTQSIAANATYEQLRIDFNAWLKKTFPNVIDIAPVVADPFDKKYLRRTPGGAAGWYGDGVHYTQAAKRAIAEKIAAWPGWDFPVPSPYQKIAVATFTPAGAVVLVSPDGTKYQLTVANGGALSAVAI